jgi:hypothetical protein
MEMFFVFDDPIPYRRFDGDEPLLIYPVSLRKYFLFSYLAQCLTLERTAVTDPMKAIKAISMSYLEYLYSESEDKPMDQTNMVLLLDGLLRLVLSLPEETKAGYLDYKWDNNHKPVLVIGERVYTAEHFDELREIIAEQNEYELPNEKIQKNVRDAIEEARRYKQKLSGNKMAGLEDQCIALSAFTGWPLSQIYDMSARKFLRSIKRVNHMIYQDKYLSAEMSGMVSFKDKSVLSGWLADIDREDDYSDVTSDLSTIENKVNMSEAMNKIKGNK